METTGGGHSYETYLICTVGGSPEPLLRSIKEWQPARIVFVHSPLTRSTVDEVVAQAASEGNPLDAGRWDPIEIVDEQDLAGCIERLRPLTGRVQEWVGRGPRHRVVVDFTGGTKCMSCALTLQARRWPCEFSYIGGRERTKGGVGIVVTGREEVVHSANPWEADAHAAVEEFVVLFDERAYASAKRTAEEARSRVRDPRLKQELNVLVKLAEACDAWDRFRHDRALQGIKQVLRQSNDLEAVLGGGAGRRLLSDVRRASEHLGALLNEKPPHRLYILDIVANTHRRREEGRMDDAVARLYRAIEALAQVALRQYFEDPDRISLQKLPAELRPKWSSRAEDGLLRLGLRDDYLLLDDLGDPLGAIFRERGLHDLDRSPLSARNKSILAHGFEPVSEGAFEVLFEAAVALGSIDERELPCVPRIGGFPRSFRST